MANSVTTNPITIDTAGVITTRPITIKAIRVIYGNNDDDVLLVDSVGGPVFEGKAGTLGTTRTSENLTVPGGIKFNGLTATTIDSGTVVYLYLK